MLRYSVIIVLFGCALAVPTPQQYQAQQSEEVPPHLLRQYFAAQQATQSAQATQVVPRPAHIHGAAPAPARLPYSVQEDPRYQAQFQAQPQPQYHTQAQYQPQPQPQQPAYRPQYQAQRPSQQQDQREPQEDYDPHPSYQFGFDVNDDQFTNYQNRKEQRDGDVIKGSYSVVDSDGFIRTVTYTADPKEGFKAEVSRQPTDIVVKIPTPKPQTLVQNQPIHHHQPQIQHQAQHQAQHQPQHQPQHQAQHQAQQAPQQYYRYQQ